MGRPRLWLAGILGILVITLLLSPAEGAGIELVVSATTNNPNGANQMAPGDLLFYQIGVRVDPTAGGPGGNRGLAGIVYDVFSPQGAAKGYMLAPLLEAQSGYSHAGSLATVSAPYFMASSESTFATYGGGWGFDTGGFPTGGNVTTPGTVKSAGISGPLSYIADVQSAFPGNQPNTRLDVGVGNYMMDAADPNVPGMMGGFGQDLGNSATPGDGTWLMQEGVIDTSGWDKQTYEFTIVPTAGNLFRVLDYNLDYAAGQYAMLLDPGEFLGTSFSFTLVPEPMSLVIFAASALFLRRRRG